MKSGSLSISRILLVFLYLFVYGTHSSRSDDGADLLMNLIGRLQAQQGIQSTGEGNANENDGADDDSDEDEDADSDGESDMENYEYEEGPTIFDPYGEEDDDDETANNGEDEEYSDGLPRVGHAHDEDDYDESADSGDEMMLDFFEDDFVINDRANAMDPVLLIAAAKNKLVPIERKGVVRRRDESQHEDEAEINESASPNKRRRLDDDLVDDKFKRSHRSEFDDILPALMGEGSSNGDGDGGKRDDKKLNDIWNGNKSKSPKNRPNKENKNNNSNDNNNDDDDMPALVEDIDDDEPAQSRSNESTGQQILDNSGIYDVLMAHRNNMRNLNNQNTSGNGQGGSDDEMPILVDSDSEADEARPKHSTQAEPIVINDTDSLPGLTSEEESDDEVVHRAPSSQQPNYPVFSPRYFSQHQQPACPVHAPRPTCCPHHEEQGFVTDDEGDIDSDDDEGDIESDGDDYDEDDYDDDESDEDMDYEHNHEHVANFFRDILRDQVTGQQRTSQSSSASSSLRQESPFLRGGASPTASHHLHSSSASIPGRRRRRVDKDQEEYNEDYEVDLNKPVDVPPLVWSDDESGGEEEHDVEEISSDSEQPGQPQTPEQQTRLQRILMANLSNAIMSGFFNQHQHDNSDSDDDDDDEDDEEEVPFSYAPNLRLTPQPQVTRANEQGGFQFNFDQPFNPSVNRQRGINIAHTTPQNTSFNFSHTTTSSSVGPAFNFSSGQSGSATHVQSVNFTWNYSDGNDSDESAPHSDFDPNSLHDVD